MAIYSPQNTGVYWVGSDNNLWVKDSSGVNKSNKTVSDLASNGYSWIKDPNPQNKPNDGGTTGSGNYWASGGTGGVSYNPAEVAQYDQGINTANAALGRTDNQLNTALGNIGKQYSQKYNEQQTGYNNAENQYSTNTATNQQQYRTNKNTINDAASGGLRGLQRLLGSRNAGGGSSALFSAPQAVADVATRERSGAGQTYGQNQAGLDTTWGTFKNDFDNERRKLTDWRSSQENEARSKIAQTKQSLLSTLAELTGKRAAALGGSATGAAQPYLDQVNSLAGQIDQLAAINPTYTGNTPVYKAPDIASYTVNQTEGPTLGQSVGGEQLTPFLSMLLGQKRDENPLVRNLG
jgi:hypothetical protein